MKLTYLNTSESIYKAGCTRACVNTYGRVGDASEYTGVTDKGNVGLTLKCCAASNCNDLKLLSSWDKYLNFILWAIFSLVYFVLSCYLVKYLNRKL
jgi:hypothetical protein